MFKKNQMSLKTTCVRFNMYYIDYFIELEIQIYIIYILQ